MGVMDVEAVEMETIVVDPEGGKFFVWKSSV